MLRGWFFRIAALMTLLLPFGATGIASAETVPFQDMPKDLPQPLSDADVARYQQIFDLQLQKKWKEADKLISKLENDLLLGRVLSQRYLHPTGWRSTYKQLRGWLNKYNDHPAASRISWLAKKRRPANAKTAKDPKKGYLNGYGRSGIGSSYVIIPASNKGRAAPLKRERLPAISAFVSVQAGLPARLRCCQRPI